jgi:hypothetical protein
MIKQRFNKFELPKLIICLLIVSLLAAISACSIGKPFHLENYLGLYKLVDKKCSVADNSFNPCDSTLFIELVKGQFIGISDSDIGYVFWSGDPAIDPELHYTAHLIGNISTSKLTDNKFWLNNNSNTQEYFYFSKGKLSNYYLMYMSGNSNAPRIIEYTLMPAMRSSEPRFRLNYPGNK